MARKRKGVVRESQEELRQLQTRNRGGSLENRIRMLLLLDEDPARTVEQVAVMLRCSERTVRRWWKIYQEQELNALLTDRPADSPAQARTNAEQETAAGIDVVGFLNTLPMCGEPVAWINVVRESLRRFLGDVDRISIEINVHCDLYDPARNESSMVITQHFEGDDSAAPTDRKPIITSQRRTKSPSEILLDTLRRHEFPFGEYFPPGTFEYYIHEGQTYVGAILLWRNRNKAPISSRTLAAMEELRPFLTFLLTDCIARRRRRDFDIRMFTEIVSMVGRNEGLTERENDVLLHHLLGADYEEIAQRLTISVDTVRKHVKSIHRKSGAHTYTELFARYFTPLRET